jgi:hypothetical protein
MPVHKAVLVRCFAIAFVDLQQPRRSSALRFGCGNSGLRLFSCRRTFIALASNAFRILSRLRRHSPTRIPSGTIEEDL